MLEERELRKAFLCACRILQWAGERLPVDLASCKMRGMAEPIWDRARILLIDSGAMDAQLSLLVSPTHGQELLQAHFYELIFIKNKRREIPQKRDRTRYEPRIPTNQRQRASFISA